MKELSEKELERRKLRLLAIEDYFGGKIPEDQFNQIVKAIQRGSIKDLSDEDRTAAYHIDANLHDVVYIANLKRDKNEDFR